MPKNYKLKKTLKFIVRLWVSYNNEKRISHKVTATRWRHLDCFQQTKLEWQKRRYLHRVCKIVLRQDVTADGQVSERCSSQGPNSHYSFTCPCLTRHPMFPSSAQPHTLTFHPFLQLPMRFCTVIFCYHHLYENRRIRTTRIQLNEISDSQIGENNNFSVARPCTLVEFYRRFR